MIRNILLRSQLNTKKLELFKSIRSSSSRNASILNQELQPVEQYELQETHIKEAINATPILVNVSREMWKNAHETFLNHGLSTRSFLQIVTCNPKVLFRSPHKIVDTLEHWRSCQFGEYFLFLLITKYPSLMDVDDKRFLLKQIFFLKSYVSTNKNVWKLLMNCPTLLEETEASIEAKILYMKEKMRIEIPEIVKSEALGKSLDDIKCRHVFMERLGLFKPRSLKANPNEKSNNTRLYKITDTSEKTFATKICHVSLAEYEAFRELYGRELDRICQEEDWDAEKDLLSDDEN